MFRSRCSMLWVLPFLLFTMLLSAFAPLAPAPPMIIVNHETQQYAKVTQGDECIYCEPPEGWVILGRYGEVEPPAGYTETQVEMVCTRSREARCCLPGHSGARGDCGGFWLTAAHVVLCPLLVLAVLVVLIIWLVRRRRKKAANAHADGAGTA